MWERIWVGVAVVLVVMGVALGEEGAGAGPATTKVVLPMYAIGTVVEVKSGAFWEKGKIVNRDGDVYWINYDRFKGNKFFYEWVTVDRVRKPGETRDIPFVMPGRRVGRNRGREGERARALVNLGLAEGKPAAPGGGGEVEWGRGRRRMCRGER